ncbi:MAG: class I SAM-dependent methyltransferase [Chloroflexota bacterium]|nr:class I SAM-dependent methyltransferase [Chloroflexota bacterium]
MPAADGAADGIANYIRRRQIDFLDFGCSHGASLDYARATFGGHRGLGVDLSPQKVENARAAGHDAVVADVTALQLGDNSVDFVTMIHFLEHLPSFDAALRAIGSAIRVARDFVYIRHPWFDSDAHLLELGYKFYWSDWAGHSLHFDRLAFVRALNRLKHTGRWTLMGRNLIRDTTDPSVIPLLAPVDSFGVDPDEARQREPVAIQPRAFREVACLIQSGEIARFNEARSSLDSRHAILLEFDGMRRLASMTASE